MSFGKEGDIFVRRLFDHPSAVFGAALAKSAQDDIDNGRQYLSPKAWQIAASLSIGIKGLISSDDPMDAKTVKSINQRFRDDDMPTFQEQKGDSFDTMPDQDILPWLAHANYRDLAVFSLWNFQRQKDIEAKLKALRPELKTDSLDRVSYIVDQGIYPQKALKHYENFYDNYGPFLPIDSFLSGITDWEGVCMDSHIGIANSFTDPSLAELDLPTLQDTVFHEATHAIGHGRSGRGFSSGLHDKQRQSSMEEFFVTHATTIGMTQDAPRVLSPSLRPEKYHVYRSERELYAHASTEIPVELWGYAFMISRYTLRGQRLRKEIRDNLARAFGSWNDHQKFANEYSKTANLSERAKLAAQKTLELYGFTDMIDEDEIPLTGPVVSVIAFKD